MFFISPFLAQFSEGIIITMCINKVTFFHCQLYNFMKIALAKIFDYPVTINLVHIATVKATILSWTSTLFV